MDSTRPNKTSKFAKTFQKVINLKNTSSKHRSNSAFCLLIPQEKLRCCESRQFKNEEIEEAKEESKSRAAMEAFVAKIFATISSVKAAYAELQMAQFPYNHEAIQSADQAVVDELKLLSELKHSFVKKQIDFSPPHVTLMLAEIQEQQALMKTYEITMKKMRNEIDNKEIKLVDLKQQLLEIIDNNRSNERKMNASGSFSILDKISLCDVVNPSDFALALQYSLRSVRSFVRLLIREMERADWDIEAAAKAIYHQCDGDHDNIAFVFESFVCREMFNGFNDPAFDSIHSNLPDEIHDRRVFCFEQFKKLRSVSAVHFLKRNANSLFGRFLKMKYFRLVHPKMEVSFYGDLKQRRTVNDGGYPESQFFEAFAEMGRRVWLLHCLAFSFEDDVSVFRVERGARFSEVYMESVTEAAEGGLRVAFTVVPGFKVGRTVVQSQVCLFPVNSPTKRPQALPQHGSISSR